MTSKFASSAAGEQHGQSLIRNSVGSLAAGISVNNGVADECDPQAWRTLGIPFFLKGKDAEQQIVVTLEA